MLKLAHQFQKQVILRDEYIKWFFDEALVHSLQDHPLNVESEPEDDAEKFQRIAYWYTILREKHGDEVCDIWSRLKLDERIIPPWIDAG